MLVEDGYVLCALCRHGQQALLNWRRLELAGVASFGRISPIAVQAVLVFVSQAPSLPFFSSPVMPGSGEKLRQNLQWTMYHFRYILEF